MPPGYVRRGNALIRIEQPNLYPHLSAPPERTSRARHTNGPLAKQRPQPAQDLRPLQEKQTTSPMPSTRQAADTESDGSSESETNCGDGPDIYVPQSKNFKTCLELILPPVEAWEVQAPDPGIKPKMDEEPARMGQGNGNGARWSDTTLPSAGSEPSDYLIGRSEGNSGLLIKSRMGEEADLPWTGNGGESDSSSNISGDWPVYVTSSGEDSGAEVSQPSEKAFTPANDHFPSKAYTYSKRKAYQLVREPMGGNKKRLRSNQSKQLNPSFYSEPPANSRTRLVRMGSKIYRSGNNGHSRKLEIVSRSSNTQNGADIKLKHTGANIDQRIETTPGLCTSFQKTGVCKWGPKCRYRHDPSKVAVCPSWLHGKCTREDCRLQHARRPELMPNCVHFLNGRCSRKDCPYSHAIVHKNSPSCSAFILGYCPNGFRCPRKHFTPKMLADQDANNT